MDDKKLNKFISDLDVPDYFNNLPPEEWEWWDPADYHDYVKGNSYDIQPYHPLGLDESEEDSDAAKYTSYT